MQFICFRDTLFIWNKAMSIIAFAKFSLLFFYANIFWNQLEVFLDIEAIFEI